MGCVCETLRAYSTGEKLALIGRFGVFAEGYVKLEFYDERHRVLREASNSNVRIPANPMHALVFPDKKHSGRYPGPLVPKDAVGIALTIYDSTNARTGDLAHATIYR